MNSRILKQLLTCFIALIIFAAAAIDVHAYNDDAPQNKRFWGYFSMLTMFSHEWGVLVKPGFLYEYYNSEGEARELVLGELFAGPVYIRQITDDFKLVFAFGYYYLGFPKKDYKDTDGDGKGDKDSYWYSHNFEISPEISYRIKDLTLSNKMVFHNKFYANNDIYKTDDDKRGFSLLMKDFIKVSYAVSKYLNITAGDEFYIGLAEDKHTATKYKNLDAKGEPFFERGGFLRNRIYMGGDIIVTPEIKLTPYYVHESLYNPDKNGKLTGRNHIVMATLTYIIKLYE